MKIIRDFGDFNEMGSQFGVEFNLIVSEVLKKGKGDSNTKVLNLRKFSNSFHASEKDYLLFFLLLTKGIHLFSSRLPWG